MKGNRNGAFRKICLNKKKAIISKKDYSGRNRIIKTPNPLGKYKSKTRGTSVSKAQMEKVYFYSFQTKEYKEFESIKTGKRWAFLLKAQLYDFVDTAQNF